MRTLAALARLAASIARAAANGCDAFALSLDVDRDFPVRVPQQRTHR